jgi:hypothetical protein
MKAIIITITKAISLVLSMSLSMVKVVTVVVKAANNAFRSELILGTGETCPLILSLSNG